MASVKDVERIADELQRLVGDLRSELQGSPDFEQLTQIADEISERADHAAETFSSVNETLMSRIGEVIGGKTKRSSSGGQSREKSKAASS